MSAIFATAGAVCLISAAFLALRFQYTIGFDTARDVIVAVTVSFFLMEIVAFLLGLVAFFKISSSRGNLSGKGDSLFGIISSAMYITIVLFFVVQVML